MKRETKKAPQTNINNEELFEALRLLQEERGIPMDYMMAQIQKAIITACKNTYGNNDDAKVIMDPETNRFEVLLYKTVVETVQDPNREIAYAAARQLSSLVELDQKVAIRLDPKQFGRIAISTVRSMIRQGIRDGEKNQMLAEFQSKKEEIVTADVERIDAKTGNVTLRLGKAIAVLPKSEQVGTEVIREGGQLKVYVVDVKTGDRGPRALLSRIHPDLVKRLFEREVPEIYDGTVVIKSISREAGSRTKLAVLSTNPDVDAIGACIGTGGARVRTIVEELNGEKIDIIEYSEDASKFVAAALSPSEVVKVEIDEENPKVCKVIVPDSQLSLAIGNKGQNVRLAAKLTGYKIDIRPESGAFEDDTADDQIDYIGDGLDNEE